jgi:catechol 2,3-dioxygenase-like lactoylglutathione lyase family enzyme
VQIFSRTGKAAFRLPEKRLAFTGSIVLVVLTLSAPESLLAAEFRGVRLNVSDPEAAAQWYCKHLGGTLVGGDAAGPERLDATNRPSRAVRFGRTTLEFVLAKSPSGMAVSGSVGSGVDHLGFGYADLGREMERFAKSGVEIVSGIEQEGPIRYAFIKDRWGTLIELVEDREIHSFHHVHLATTDPKTTLKWYTDVFGGRVTRFAGVLPGIRYGDVWVLVKTAKRPSAPTEGRAIDSLRWSTADLNAAMRQFRARQVSFSVAGASARAKVIVVAAPDQVRTELRGTNE